MTQSGRKSLFEKPLLSTKVKSANVKPVEMLLGYLVGPFCAMLANGIFTTYLTRYFRDVLFAEELAAGSALAGSIETFLTLFPILSAILIVIGNLVAGRRFEAGTYYTFELLVDHKLPRLAAPVSAANHREFYAVGRDGLPVYLALVERDVDAAPGRIFLAGVLGPIAREAEVLFFEHGGRHALGGRYPLIAPARVHIDLALVLVGRGLTAAGGEGYG